MEQGKPQQAVAEAVCVREGTAVVFVGEIGTGVQRLVVKNRQHLPLLEMLDEAGPRGLVGQHDVETVGVVPGKAGNDGNLQPTGLLQRAQGGEIPFPQLKSSGVDLLESLELRPEQSRQDVRGKKRGSDVDPAVFVRFTAKERTAVGSLLPENLRPDHVLHIANGKQSTFPAVDVLGLVE